MPVYLLDEELWFPPADEADEDGLLAAGGDLSPDRLLLAYNSGIFPWFSEEDVMPLWWSPDPRFVLFPDELKVSRSMKQLIKKETFEFRINTAFADVINNCRLAERKGQDGTWITQDIVDGYTALHEAGYAYSAEAWQDDVLAGGLYGVLLGKVFFGESMFSAKTNASKYAFIRWVEFLREQRVALIDCQVYTGHLESLGARMIPRKKFIELIADSI